MEQRIVKFVLPMRLKDDIGGIAQKNVVRLFSFLFSLFYPIPT
jgi:hypothetical protein